MHGHGFEVVLQAELDRDERGEGPDFDRLGAAWTPLHHLLHQACLNDLPGLENPTSEVLSAWLWERLIPSLPTLSGVGVYETATAGCHYDGQSYRIFKEQRFESALRLLRAPDGSPERRLHGHGYRLRLHLSAPLDQVMGWVLDYGDVKERFRPVFKQIDHRLLDELPGPPDADPASLARWLREEAAARIEQLDRIDLLQSPGCGAVLCWGDSGPVLSP